MLRALLSSSAQTLIYLSYSTIFIIAVQTKLNLMFQSQRKDMRGREKPESPILVVGQSSVLDADASNENNINRSAQAVDVP